MTTPAKIHDKHGEALEMGPVVCQAKRLATHLRPDLDAALAIWICQRIRRQASVPPAEVIFLPSSSTSVDIGVLGISLGQGKGLQRFGPGRTIRRSAIRGSAAMAVFRALPDEDRSILEPIVQAISDANEKGDNIHSQNLQESYYPDGTKRWDNEALRRQVMSTTIWAIAEDLSYVAADQDILKIWGTVFDGMLAAGLKRREAVHASDQADYRYKGVLAILPHNAPMQTSKEAFHKGAKVVLFSSYIGGDQWVLGISRKSGDESRFIDFHDYQDILKKWLPDIFIHPGGYMAGWTIKAPLVCSADEFQYRRQALLMGVVEIVGKALQSKG
jgi:hypothetical protein